MEWRVCLVILAVVLCLQIVEAKKKNKVTLTKLNKQFTSFKDLVEKYMEEAGAKRNIAQCSWYSDDSAPVDDGSLQDCAFDKEQDDTVLRVEFNGGIRVRYPGGHPGACRRWFFTLNGAECASPASIDAQYMVYHDSDLSPDGQNIHRSAALFGYCRNIPSGAVNVAFNVGDCADPYFQRGTISAGWASTSRIVIEEIDVMEDSDIN